MERLILTCFGLGWLPEAPGTWACLPVALAFGLLMYYGASARLVVISMATLVAIAGAACIRYAPVSIAATGRNDPGEVVVDEFAGQALAFLVVPLIAGRRLAARRRLLLAGLGFLLFRVVDIAKLWPIDRLKDLPAGWGILADDLAAGAVAAILLCLVPMLLRSASKGGDRPNRRESPRQL